MPTLNQIPWKIRMPSTPINKSAIAAPANLKRVGRHTASL